MERVKDIELGLYADVHSKYPHRRDLSRLRPKTFSQFFPRYRYTFNATTDDQGLVLSMQSYWRKHFYVY